MDRKTNNRLCFSGDRFNVWKLGFSPIKLHELEECLKLYPNKTAAYELLDGFSNGFKIKYRGPRLALETKNLKSVFINPTVPLQKVENEINLGRIAGPFQNWPISNLRCSPIGVVPKKTGGWRLIMHLSYPPSNSVNDYIDEQHTAVHYS